MVTPLDEAQATAAIDELIEKGIDSLAISLLNSYARPDHERRLRELALERQPDLSISISSEVLAEFREYERTNVVVMNAFIRPRLSTLPRAAPRGPRRRWEWSRRSRCCAPTAA